MLLECNKCHKLLPTDSFYKKDSTRGYSYTCRACSVVLVKKWNRENRDRYNANKSAHQKRSVASGKDWKKRHKEEWNTYQREWRAQRDGKTKAELRPAWANKFFIEEAYDIARRRTEVTGIQWEVDHIVPINGKTVSGLHVEHNLQVITREANRTKGNRHWPDMPAGE